MLYEGLLLIGVLAIAFLLPQAALSMVLAVVLPGWALLFHVFVVTGIYFVWYWRHGGQTLAMQTWRIRLTSTDNRPPPVRQLLLRYALAWPSLFCGGIGVIWGLFDRDRQFLHDRLAQTRLVFKPA